MSRAKKAAEGMDGHGAAPSLAALGLGFLVEHCRQVGENEPTGAIFRLEQVLLSIPFTTSAEAVAWAQVALQVIDVNAGCENSEEAEAETVNALRALRRSVRLLAGAAGVDFAVAAGGFYATSCRRDVLEPDERAAHLAEVAP